MDGLFVCLLSIESNQGIDREDEKEEEKEKSEGREREEKREEEERFEAPSGGPGGESGGRPRRWPRGGGGGGGGGMEAKDGSPERKTATSRGDFHRSRGPCLTPPIVESRVR